MLLNNRQYSPEAVKAPMFAPQLKSKSCGLCHQALHPEPASMQIKTTILAAIINRKQSSLNFMRFEIKVRVS